MTAEKPLSDENLDILTGSRERLEREYQQAIKEVARIKEKADKWDIYYGQELHPNPIIQAKCDRTEKEEPIKRAELAEARVAEAREWLYNVCLGCKLFHENNCHDCSLNNMNLIPLRKALGEDQSISASKED